jgi:uncharacterized Ntn-hydrolase superfamily protein
VGALATQAKPGGSLGPIGLALLRNGRSASATQAALRAADSGEALRQVGVIDVAGRTGGWTGDECIPVAGELEGDGYRVQGNMLANAEVLERMATTYETAAGGPFSQRLLAALDAAETAGGDVRGRQSAAIRIVDGAARPEPATGVLLDIRVIDHAEPLAELRRLVRLAESHALLDDWRHPGGPSRIERYREARRQSPEAVGLAFRVGLELAAAGDMDGARRELGHAFRADPRWRTALQRYADAGRVAPSLLPQLLDPPPD